MILANPRWLQTIRTHCSTEQLVIVAQSDE